MVYSMNGVAHELGERTQIHGLKKYVEDFLTQVPDFFQDGPRAILARHVATPNFEAFRFIRLASRMDLRPVAWQFSGDRFCTKNPDKANLAKICIHGGKNKNSQGHPEPTCEQVRIIDMGEHSEKNKSPWEGKPINEVLTKTGEKLVEAHNRLFKKYFPETEIWDSTEWLRRFGTRAKDYYIYFLGLFICHGVLFENFLPQGQEVEFSEAVVFPSIEKLKTEFGFSPLIVPVLPLEKECEKFWTWYPERIGNEFSQLSHSQG